VKDMVITGGENVYPAEVEGVLYEHPGVADVAVIGIADERWGERSSRFSHLAKARSSRSTISAASPASASPATAPHEGRGGRHPSP